MKVSVITITYNSEKTLRDTIDSVLNQIGVELEYIVVDGASKDSTMEIVHSYGDRIHRVVSEKDKGLYDALNKGLAMAGGDIIAFLHSDDVYWDENVLADVVKTFEASGADAVYGDLCYVKENDLNAVVRKWKSGRYTEGMFLNGWMPPHPAFFAKRKCYEQFGQFSLDLRSAADYELMLRFIHKFKISVAYLPRFLVRMRVGGKSNVTLSNRIKANLEDRKAWKMNQLNPRIYTLWFKPLRKIFQFLK